MHLATSVRRWLVASALTLVVASIAATTVWPDPASAEPAEAPGECMTVYRKFWDMEVNIPPPDRPENYAWSSAVPVPAPFEVTYCVQANGHWQLTSENPAFKNDPALCVGVRYADDNYGGESPPEQLATLDLVDRYGVLDPQAPPEREEEFETYCRQGTTWQRQAPPAPTGAHQTWSDSCITVFVATPNPPAQTTSVARVGPEWNDDDSDSFEEPDLELIDVTNDLQLYCRQTGTGDWFLVPGATPDDKLPNQNYGVPVNPREGNCIGFMGQGGGWEAPEVLPPGADPQSAAGGGKAVDIGTYQDDAGTYRVKHTMCMVDGQWRRADKMPRIGCAAGLSGSGVSFMPAECWGRFPTGRYEINYDGGGWSEFRRKIYGILTDFAFSIGKGATQVSLWSLSWAYDYNIRKFSGFTWDISESFRRNLTDTSFDGFQLINLGWVILFGFVAINVLRGRSSMALGEVVASVVLLSLATFLMDHRMWYLNRVWDFMNETTTDLLVVGSGKKPDDPSVTKKQVVDETLAALHKAFVEDPYDYINWGRLLPEGDNCANARDQVLLGGPHGDDGSARHIMKAYNCAAEEKFNKKPTAERLLSAIISAIAAIAAAFFLVAVGLTVVLAKFMTLMLFVLLPFAVLTVVLPGGGRRLFWIWATSLAQAVGAVACMGFLLALMLQALKKLFELTGDVSMVERFALVLLLVVMLRAARTRMLESGQAAAARWADNLSNVRLGGGGAAWQGATGTKGVGFAGMDRLLSSAGARAGRFTGAATLGAGRMAGRTAAVAGRVAAAPVRFAGRSTATRWAERRTANRSIKNLVNKDVLAGNLPAGTPATTRGLARAVKRLRREHGDDHVPSKPGSTTSHGGGASGTTAGKVSLVKAPREQRMAGRADERAGGWYRKRVERNRERAVARRDPQNLRDLISLGRDAAQRRWSPALRRRDARAEDIHQVKLDHDRKLRRIDISKGRDPQRPDLRTVLRNPRTAIRDYRADRKDARSNRKQARRDENTRYKQELQATRERWRTPHQPEVGGPDPWVPPSPPPPDPSRRERHTQPQPSSSKVNPDPSTPPPDSGRRERHTQPQPNPSRVNPDPPSPPPAPTPSAGRRDPGGRDPRRQQPPPAFRRERAPKRSERGERSLSEILQQGGAEVRRTIIPPRRRPPADEGE